MIARKILRSDATLFLWRIALVYVVLALCRIAFFAYNAETLNEITSANIIDILRGAFRFDTISLIYTNALWILLSLLPLPYSIRSSSAYRKVLFAIYFITNALLIVITNMADAIYFHYASKRMTSEEFHFTDDNSNNIALVGKFLSENIALVIFAALLIAALWFFYLPKREGERIVMNWKIYYPTQIATLLFAIAMMIGAIRGGFTHAIRPTTLSDTMRYTTDQGHAMMILSNPFCIIRTQSNKAIKVPKYFDSQEELANLFSPYHYPTEAEVRRATHKGYNVMIFILESFSAENSAHLTPQLYNTAEDKSGGKGYMPFLDTLMREGYTMRNMFANGGRSISAAPAIIGGIPSPKTPFVLMPQSIGKSYQMAAILRDKGYSTLFFCGSERSSMGFNSYAKSAGYDSYYAREDYEERYGKADFDGMWGIWDEPFMQYVSETLSQTKEPFLATQFTVSSHHPFALPEQYSDRFPAAETKIQPVTAYTDMAIRKFFEASKDKEWFNRTIFIFVSDHVSSEKMADRTKRHPYNNHIVGAIYTPDGSIKGATSEVTQQIDIAPTILGLLGNEKPLFAFGRNIFSQRDSRPKWSITHDGTAVTYDHRGDSIATIKVESSERLKAFEQQYYNHLSRRTYVAPERPTEEN